MVSPRHYRVPDHNSLPPFLIESSGVGSRHYGVPDPNFPPRSRNEPLEVGLRKKYGRDGQPVDLGVAQFEAEYDESGGFCNIGRESYVLGRLQGKPGLELYGPKEPGARRSATGLFELLPGWHMIKKNASDADRRRYTLADDSIPNFSSAFAKKSALKGFGMEHSTFSKLCERCRHTPFHSTSTKPYQLFDGKSSTWEAAERCEFCRLVVEVFGNLQGQELGVVSLEVRGSCLRLQANSQYKDLTLYKHPQSEAGPKNHAIGFPTPPKAASPMYFSLMQEWLDDCNENHRDHAKLFEETSKLPTRLIDLRNPTKFRLYHTTNNERGRFVALSHRWGDVQSFSTTQSNLNDRCSEIKADELPQTFRDAITTTRELGMHFLWIDSICIIQDDKSDWDCQSKLMETVFASAYVTIAAATATSCHQGFLNYAPIQKCVFFPVETSQGGQTHVYTSTVEQDFVRDVEEAPLNQRAWVLQERALSRRVIHFTRNQIYWECGSVVRDGCLRDGWRHISWLGDSDFPYTASRLDSSLSNSMFEDIFKTYSGLGITVLEDRPIAILGLQSRLAQFYKTKANFGVFEKYIHRSLLWRRHGLAMTRIKFEKQRVPSWSWMAYSGRIEYGSQRDWYAQENILQKNGDIVLDMDRSIILAPVVEMSPGLVIEDSETLRDAASGTVVGWISLDQDVKANTQALRCVVIGEGTAGWKDYIGTSWSEELPPGSFLWVLLVVPVPRGLEGNLDAYERRGVSVLSKGFVASHDGVLKSTVI